MRRQTNLRKRTKAEKLEHLEAEWRHLTEVMGTTNPAEMAAAFQLHESQKFSKVRALSALVAEVEDIERELKSYADYANQDIFHVRVDAGRECARVCPWACAGASVCRREGGREEAVC